MKKPLAALAGLALAASVLAACSGDPRPADAPEDAGADAFCAPIDDFLAEMYAQLDSPPSEDDMVAALHDLAEEMESVGTPSDMSAEARRGFEVFVTQIREVSVKDISGNLEDLTAGLSKADQKAGDAFLTWRNEQCPIPDIPGLDSGSE